MALTLTESLIRSRVNLTHENLEDIKSLSLPGTYHEKIVSIGTSLRKFTRLKSLDFSRNALESLQGLEHLQLLEKLNLYYNNVSSLEELKRLRYNRNLKEIDLRLNPVTRSEPDYRLYLIHMLPNLQKLDDRGVRDRERQAALMHFSSSQALEMNPVPPQPQSDVATPHPRTEMMANLIKCPTVLDNDDDVLLDIMNRQNGDLNKPRPLTGSSAREDRVEDYTLDSLKLLDQSKPARARGKPVESTQSAAIDPPSLQKDEDPHLARYKEWYPNIMSMPGEGVHKIGEAPKGDQNLFFPDEIEANSKYRGQGYFTPNPKGECDQSQTDRRRYKDPLSASDPIPKSDRGECFSSEPKHRQSRQVRSSQDDMAWTRPRLSRTSSVPAREESNYYGDAKEKTLIYSLLNLVDRYWNGSKSLHKHPKFIEQALKYLSEYTLTREHLKEDETNKLRRKVEVLEDQITALTNMKNGSSGESAAVKEAELRAALKKSHEDIKRMHAEIRHYISENRILHRKLETPNFSSNCDTCATDLPGQSMTAEELQYQNEVLNRELELMKAKMKQYTQLQELASMLQESHRSLVETNDHLLRELNDTKEKHHQEVEQMHWSYNQLKSTLDYSSLFKSSKFSQNNSNFDCSHPPAGNNNSQDRDRTGADKSLNKSGDSMSTKT
ncbi:unnamed protein product [Candidula unifasciata]|uniref:Centrosomal protein of 72 kDa n=1 Tax=Candidula unifasciata TaxID=100452 RepID=A0A8S3ZBQ5_9EUPU|nr:unnamed protein product [Candidula unifasciata]